MAQNLQTLKRRIKTSKNIAQIAKAMEMIAASKIKRAQAMVINNKPYSQAIIEHTQAILEKGDENKLQHPYLRQNEADKSMLIIFSPDRGLCGALVTNMVRKLLEIDLSQRYVVTIGKKMERIAAKSNAELVASFPMGTSLPSYSTIYPLIKLIDEYYLSNRIQKVEIFYPEFNSIFTQTPQSAQILPIQSQQIQNDEKNQNTDTKEYLFEPNTQTLLDSLLPYYLEVSLFSYLIESHTSEQAARMVAMQNAKNNAGDIADFLTLTYNKSRQERITNELLDLTNGAQVN